MEKKFILMNILGAILFFILFVIGMLYSDKMPLLILIGIFGLGGTCFFVFRITGVIINQR